ncbi:MAG: hypothetical protein QW474_03895 [Candidatus Aenigmatarchaeota archaeon]
MLKQSYTGTTTFAYDELGNLIEKHLPNGIKEEYNYDDMGRLTQITYGTTGRTISYSYDSVGNVLSMTDWTGTTNYSYDNIYQLTQATYPNTGTQTFTYDQVGNRIQDQNKTYYYNNLNQLLSTSDGTNYYYDANGNLISKTKNNQTTTYTWNEFDKLVEVNLPDGKKIRFVYGADGLRRERIEEGGRVNYLLDGLVVLAEFGDSGEVLREYVGGVSVCTGSESFYYHYDRLGSVRFLSDGNGSVVCDYVYDAFGNLLSSSGSLNQPYEYVGREGYYREEFDLYLLGVRWYDSEAGRFISRNSPYTFKGNNPENGQLIIIPPNVGIYLPPKEIKLSEKSPFDIKIHGNWCGPGWSGEEYSKPKLTNFDVPAIDSLDECCKEHDRCVQNTPGLQNKLFGLCKVKMCECLKNKVNECERKSMKYKIMKIVFCFSIFEHEINYLYQQIKFF